ncbi:flagellar biosynthetic protein FliO [Enterococcus columbae]|uniref:Flagellar protein FliO/FliZ n=1 Tax=Enterococcus columbae DSM 7374 = ATCC 51263 TaxID=1121865 RepID=S1NSX6_9ENTE|nr:flagellar biosynthetic protein FliO [Enterococcus columbae]EOT39999.1 hypothetical protein OMW_01788 [Enterococcus columbae DSM 7374 = ATCC 51263]EOW83984.1 hypothetical protein I568_01431 [Enterococcus columbae DSM 7374 = ATCC 51263]
MDLVVPIIKMVIFLLIILYLISQSLKFLNKQINPENEILQVMQRISVSKTSSIAIVKMFEKYYVMSISEQQNQIIKELSAEEVLQLKQHQQLLKQQQKTPADFSKILKKEVQQLLEKKGSQENDKQKKP